MFNWKAGFGVSEIEVTNEWADGCVREEWEIPGDPPDADDLRLNSHCMLHCNRSRD